MEAEYRTIPGEPGLTRRIREAAARDALGHAVIFSGPGDLEAAAQFTAAAMECEGVDKPCGACPACRKVGRGIHPDVTAVEDPEHKNIAMDVLRDVVADAYNLPNEGRRKIYIFPDCERLDPKAQNLLLKVVEDGPSRVAFLFCARSGAVLLPTLRSRAVEWWLQPPDETAGPGEQAQALARTLCEGGGAELTAYCAGLENSKISREELQALLSEVRDLAAAGLAASYGAAERFPLAGELARSLGRTRLSEAANVLGKFAGLCGYNVGVGHLTGALAVELSELAERAGDV